MRPKSDWNKTAIFADILFRLGLKLSETSLWEKYIFVRNTTGEGCELAEKVSNLLFSKMTPEVNELLKELDKFYVEQKRITKD